MPIKKKTGACLFVCAVMLLSAGGAAAPETYRMPEIPAAAAETIPDPEFDAMTPAGPFALTDGSGTEVAGDNGVYTITRGGEYILRGALNGRVVVDAGEAEVTLGLKGAAVTCSTGALITVKSAGKIDIEAKKNTYNVITDERPTFTEEEEHDAAVWSDEDLKISGRGILIVTSGAYAGIKSKDDLKIRNLTLKVTSAGNALRGNDSVTVESGSLVLESTGSDGIRTRSTDISKKGKQRGDVTILGGHIDLYAAFDGISAAHDVIVTGEDAVLNISTTGRAADASPAGNGESRSAKGIKAENRITVGSGRVSISAADDGIHASRGTALENGTTGAGDIAVTGGAVTISAADDAIHADGTLTIAGGSVRVTEAHEGLEANRVLIEGGSVSISARDDGINACAGADTPLIMISGGTVDVTTPGGDTDAVDSNGDITITGGYTLIRTGAGADVTAGSMDAKGAVTVTGGAVAAFGGICAVPGEGSVNTYISNGGLYPAGAYVLMDGNGNEMMTFALAADHVSLWLSCDSIVTGGSYTLRRNGQDVVTWTQTDRCSGDPLEQ